MLINTITPSVSVYYGESAQDLALMPTTTTIGQGDYPRALASLGSYAIILESNGLKKYKLRSTGWVEVVESGGGGGSGNTNIFTGTLDEWNALSPAEKASYTHLFTTDPVTTLEGYGITDAYTKDEVDALISGGGELPTKQIVIDDVFLDTKFMASKPNLEGNNIWTFNGEVYYSSSTVQLVFDRGTMTWKKKRWNGLSNFYGNNIWTIGTAPNQIAYYSSGSAQYMLNKNSGNTWATQTWSGLASFNGRNVWSSSTGTFYSAGTTQYKLSGTTWSTQTWTGLTNFNGSDVWLNGTTVYYSSGTTHYRLSGTTWSAQTWTGLTSFNGANIWKSGNNIYYSNSTTQYKLSGTAWNEQTWTGLTSFVGANVWTDPFDNSTHYAYQRNNYTLSNTAWSEESFLTEDLQIQHITDARYFWTDGDNIYYSESNYQYKYDKAQLLWEPKTWSGLTSFNGSYIWTDGDNIYYSNSTSHYVLDKATSTWNIKTWSGLTNFSASEVWTDGIDIYCGFTDVLNKATSTWNTKTWSSIPGPGVEYIWTDGTDVYYSKGNNHYVLDKENSAWNAKTWSGLTSFNGDNIWNLADDVYYSSGNSQYILDKITSTWNVKYWIELTNFNGFDIWTDGDKAYYLNFSSAVLTSKELTTLNTTVVDADIDILYSGTSSTDVGITFAYSLLDYERLVIKTKSSNINNGLVSYTYNELVIFYSEMLKDGEPNYATQKQFFLPILYQYDGVGYTTISSHDVPHDGYLMFTFGGTGSVNISAQEFYKEAIVQIASSATITIYGIGRRV